MTDKPLHTVIALDLAIVTLSETLAEHQPVLAHAWARALRGAGTRVPEFVGEGVQECLNLWVGCLTKTPTASGESKRP